MNNKTCFICKIEKDLTEFPFSRSSRSRRSSCRTCYKKLIRELKLSYRTTQRHDPNDLTHSKLRRINILRKATPKWLKRDDWILIKMQYRLARYLTKVTGVLWVVDHIIPLQGQGICGLHVPSNLRVITHIENSRKGNRLK